MHPEQVNLTKTKHYHVTVGPLHVNLYGIKGLDMVGPFVDIICEDAEAAVKTWAGLTNEICQPYIFAEVQIDQDDVEQLVGEISSLEWSFNYDDDVPNVAYEVGAGDQFLTISDCGGCIPRSNN